VLPYIEQQNVFARFDFNKPVWDPVNVPAVQSVIPAYICPSDGKAGNALQGGRIQMGWVNPGKSMGLWYPGSMGPTRDGTSPSVSCVFCPVAPPSYCCAATSDYGCCASVGGAIVPGVGLFDRAVHPVSFDDIRDGLSNTLMNGETIPEQCTYNGAYNHNFPIAGTTIPMNTMMQTDEGVDTKWWTGCGFKSRHPGGCNFALADGSVRFLADTLDYKLYNELGSRAGGEPVSLP